MGSDSNQPLLPENKKHLKKCMSDSGADYRLDQAKLDSKPQEPPKVLSFLILTAPRATIILIVYLVVGLCCFLFVNNGFSGMRTVGFIDALYFCAVTMTTVGYGDLVPNTTGAKLFTCAFVFVGFGLVGLIVGNAANYLVEKQRKLLEKAVEDQKRLQEEQREPPIESKIHYVHHKVAAAALLVLIVLAIGVGILMGLEGLSFVDAFYCVCVTVTTLGYGDHAFKTMPGRLCAIFWILASTACVAQFMLYMAELVTEERRHSLIQWVLSRKVTPFDVESADIDNDGRLSAPEFVIYKLKELGKITDDDVQSILQDFREQDADQSGTITISDIS